jgi:hypothetical protein
MTFTENSQQWIWRSIALAGKRSKGDEAEAAARDWPFSGS